MMRWSKLRTRVEEFFADSVKGRVGLHSTRYGGSSGRDWITLDGQELVNMPHWYSWHVWRRRKALADGEDQDKLSDYESLFQYGSLGESLFDYLTMPIDGILGSPNILIRALGMLDRRVGKRRLKTLVDDNAHPLVRLLHRFRCDAEGVTLPNPQAAETVNLRRPASPHRDKTEERRRADARLRARKKRNARTLIERIYQGELADSDLDTELARQLREGFDQAQDRDVLLAP